MCQVCCRGWSSHESVVTTSQRSPASASASHRGQLRAVTTTSELAASVSSHTELMFTWRQFSGAHST